MASGRTPRPPRSAPVPGRSIGITGGPWELTRDLPASRRCCQRTNGVRRTGRGNGPVAHNNMAIRVTDWLTAKAAEDCTRSGTLRANQGWPVPGSLAQKSSGSWVGSAPRNRHLLPSQPRRRFTIAAPPTHLAPLPPMCRPPAHVRRLPALQFGRSPESFTHPTTNQPIHSSTHI